MVGQPPPKGLIVDLLTPVKLTGEIDGRSLGRYLDRLMPYAQAFLLGGPCLGQGRSMNPDQHEELLEKTLVVVRGQVPLFIWFSQELQDQSRENLIRLNKRLSKKSYDGPIYWVDTPLLYHSNRGLPHLYQDYASLVGEDFILHNDPGLVNTVSRPFKRANIRTSILKELGQNERIRGLIFSGSLDRSHNYQRAVRSRKDFKIYDGDESRFLNFPSLGGVVSRGVNLIPKIWSRITLSSLQMDSEQDYPDSRSQIWEMGGYLRDLIALYDLYGVKIMKRALYEMGILEESEADEDTNIPEDVVKNLMEIVNRINV
jgi:dihydrodipicolinate synthase/N-acetylneuraminate lyase